MNSAEDIVCNVMVRFSIYLSISIDIEESLV